MIEFFNFYMIYWTTFLTFERCNVERIQEILENSDSRNIQNVYSSEKLVLEVRKVD